MSLDEHLLPEQEDEAVCAVALRQARRENDFGVGAAAVHCAPRERRNTHDSGLCACVCLNWEPRVQIHAQEPPVRAVGAREPGALLLAPLAGEGSGGRARVPVRAETGARVSGAPAVAGAEPASRSYGDSVVVRPHAGHAGRVQVL